MIHILFDSSAAGTLRQVLSARGQRNRVVDLTESLDWGPISFADFKDRERWLDQHAPNDFGGWDWIAEGVGRFKDLAKSDDEKVIWIAPQSASDQAGFYWYLSEFGGESAQMIVADYPLKEAWKGQTPSRLGELQQDAIAALLDTCPRVPWDTSKFFANRWQQLVEEGALIRTVEKGILQSAPQDYFDETLLIHCPNEWTKWHRVVGDAMIDAGEAGSSPDGALLVWRLRELIRAGRVACNGSLPKFGSAGTHAARVRRL